MAEDFDNHRRIFDGGDDLQGAAAVRAVFDVDVEDPGPAHARRFSLGGGVIGWWLGGKLCRSGNDFPAQLRIVCLRVLSSVMMNGNPVRRAKGMPSRNVTKTDLRWLGVSEKIFRQSIVASDYRKRFGPSSGLARLSDSSESNFLMTRWSATNFRRVRRRPDCEEVRKGRTVLICRQLGGFSIPVSPRHCKDKAKSRKQKEKTRPYAAEAVQLAG